MERYLNREDAGKRLAKALAAYANRKDAIVLALPRGGVPVAYEVAKALHLPLDVFIVRKLGAPGHAELAIGAIALGDVTVFNDEIITDLHIQREHIERVLKQEQDELKRREQKYRGDRPFPTIQNKIVLLIDDGIATGASMRVAIKALRQLKPAKIVIAVPVAQKKMSDDFHKMVDQVICPLQPLNLYAVGGWYDDFSQTEDAEVHALLKKIKSPLK